MDAVRPEIRHPSKAFIDELRRDPPRRIRVRPSCSAAWPRRAARASHNVKCNRMLHEQCASGRVTTTEAPRMPTRTASSSRRYPEGLTRVELRFGFMEEPNVPEALAVAMARGQIETFDLTRVIYYTGHETIIPSGRRPGLPRWREALFALMHHNAQLPGRLFQNSGWPNHGNRRRIRNLSQAAWVWSSDRLPAVRSQWEFRRCGSIFGSVAMMLAGGER